MVEVKQFSFDEAPVVEGALESLGAVVAAKPELPVETPEVARFWAIRERDNKRLLRKEAGVSNAINADDRHASRALVYRINPEPQPEPERAPKVQGIVEVLPGRGVMRAARAKERQKMAKALNEAAGRVIVPEGPGPE